MIRTSSARSVLALAALSFAFVAGEVQAASTSPGHDGADGGNGLSNGMPGCRGGTDPSPDGKFYIPGTKRQCNPGKQDRAKVK